MSFADRFLFLALVAIRFNRAEPFVQLWCLGWGTHCSLRLLPVLELFMDVIHFWPFLFVTLLNI